MKFFSIVGMVVSLLFLSACGTAVSSSPTGTSSASTTTETTASDSGPVPDKIIALTFDDGPSSHTARLLDTLARYDVKASFFVVKTSYINIIKRTASEGHTVAIHSYTHDYASIYKK